jgi:hypothetical protein
MHTMKHALKLAYIVMERILIGALNSILLLHCFYIVSIQGDQKVSEHLMITI